MYKITLAIIAALIAPTTAEKMMEDFKCYDDLVVVGFADSNCTKFAWEVAVKDKKRDDACTLFPEYKIDNYGVWYNTIYCSERSKYAYISFKKDDKCLQQHRGQNNKSLQQVFTFGKGECRKVKNLDKNAIKDNMEYLYYQFSRNNTMYQQWKNGNMTNGNMTNGNMTNGNMTNGKDGEAAKGKDDDKMRMSGGMNGNKMNMTKGNMSTSVNFTVEGIKFDGSMTENNRTQYRQQNISGDGYELSMKMSETKNTSKNSMMEYRVKFDQYFEYGMQASGMAKGSMTKQCSNTKDCNGMYYSKMCCVSAIMTDKKSGTQDSMFRCMNYRLAQANFQMKMNDMTVQMQCTDSKSSAVKMTSALVASMVSMILMALY